MVFTDTLEGTSDRRVTFAIDCRNEVLDLRRSDDRDAATFAEETPEGYVLHRHAETDESVALTVVSWWTRFGHDADADSLKALERCIEPLAQRLLIEAGIESVPVERPSI
jgi:hypothetical protein